MPARGPKDGYIDALRLTEREQGDILARLDAKSALFQGDNRRDGSRFRYQIPSGLIVEITHPGGTVTSYLVRPRDLSSRGMAFLHGAFVYPNSPCRLILRTIKGADAAIAGKVVRCQHVTGRAHEVGIAFAKTIKLQDYLAFDSPADAGISTELPELRGQVLYIESSVVDRELLRFHLRHQGVTVTMASTVAEGMTRMGKLVFDVVLADIDQLDVPVAKLIETLRSGKHSGPVIAVTADESGPNLEAIKAEPRLQVLVKPYPLESLLKTLGAVLPRQGTGRELTSDFWANEEMRPLITTFVHDMRDKLLLIEEQARSGAWPVVQKMSLELKGAAGGYGFGSIQQAAQDLHVMSKSQQAIEQMLGKIKDLIFLAEAARSTIDQAQ